MTIENAKNNSAIPLEYYWNEDVLFLSRDLIGKYLFTEINKELTGGMIVETEAYHGVTDKASHAYGNRRTKRTEMMFQQGGVSYIYLCYGIHSLFNVVTNNAGVPHAILIRAIEPSVGMEAMLQRRKKTKMVRAVTAGPGSLTQALGLTTHHNGLPLNSKTVWLEDRGIYFNESDIITSPRVGIDYAGEDAHHPWRFRLKGSLWTS